MKTELVSNENNVQNLTRAQKLELFRLLDTTGLYDEWIRTGTLLKAIREVWDIDNMPSNDQRYKYKAEDLKKHCIDNNDIPNLYDLFVEELHALQLSDEEFTKLITVFVNGDFYRIDGKEIQDKVVRIVNTVLLPINRILERMGNSEVSVLPIFQIIKRQESGDSSKIPDNKIPIYLQTGLSGRRNARRFLTEPKEIPCLQLVQDEWNDYDCYTLFRLFYFDTKDVNEAKWIGGVKIAKRMIEGEDNSDTSKLLQIPFTGLSSDFVSLGYESDYYENIKDVLPNDYMSVLKALNDASCFPTLSEKFEQEPIFRNSLLRDKGKTLLIDGRFILESCDISSLYNFTFDFIPFYSKNKDITPISFRFETDAAIPKRLIAIIGENGVGKTQLLTRLPYEMSIDTKNEKFAPSVPLYRKVIAVSNSVYDHYKHPETRKEFSYVYCGASIDHEENKLFTRKNLGHKIIKAAEKINENRNGRKLFEILSNIIPEGECKTLFKENLEIDLNMIKNLFLRLSSGESSCLFLLTSIVSEIVYDSLILYDEPENHLHPNAITNLMNALYQLLDEYQSYAIIATHSPLVVREIPASNVLVMRRDSGKAYISKIGFQSFGSDLSRISREIFGNNETESYYQKQIRKIINNKRSQYWDDIFDEVADGLDFDLGVRCMIAYYKENNQKQ